MSRDNDFEGDGAKSEEMTAFKLKGSDKDGEGGWEQRLDRKKIIKN